MRKAACSSSSFSWGPSQLSSVSTIPPPVSSVFPLG